LLGNVLLSQNPAVQVPLALEGLTVVFEMGTRGSPPPSLPNVVRFTFCLRKVHGTFKVYSLKTRHEVKKGETSR
jgi:hypothetical protein